MARLGDMIKAERERLGFSLREFAEKCNLSHSYIKNLEDGDPRTGKDIVPTLSSLEKLAPIFNMTVEELLKTIGYISSSEEEGAAPYNLKIVQTEAKAAPFGYESDDKGYEKSFPSFFCRKKTSMDEEKEKPTPPSHSMKDERPLYLKEDLREFVLNPANEEYLRLAKDLRDKNIKVKFIRDVLFDE